MTQTKIKICKTWSSKSSPKRTWRCTLQSATTRVKATVLRTTLRIVRARIRLSISCARQGIQHQSHSMERRRTSRCLRPQRPTLGLQVRQPSLRIHQQLQCKDLDRWLLSSPSRNWCQRMALPMAQRIPTRSGAVQLTKKTMTRISRPRPTAGWSPGAATYSSTSSCKERGETSATWLVAKPTGP